MERLTFRKDGAVMYCKDNNLMAPVHMSGFDVRQALRKLADYEDAEENGTFIHKELQLDERGIPHCPFCGSELGMQIIRYGETYFSLICKNQICPGHWCRMHFCTMEEAKKAWSRRP